jgi:signal transduction histidine kinase/CheY-like chemotaxis protein
MAALLSLLSFRSMGAAAGLTALGLNAVTAVLCLGYFALRLSLARRRLARAEHKLRVAEERHARILNFNSAEFDDKSNLIEMTLNHMNQGVAVMRPDGRIWLYNQRALEYAGIDDPPFPPTIKRIFEIQLENEEFGPDLELLPPDIRPFFSEGKGKLPKSYVRRRPNGTILEVRSDPMPDGSMIQTYTDITELALAKEAAEAAARAKASFLATMSHEIRTPLNGVLATAKILRDSALSAEQRRFVETINTCGEALLVVINDILDFSKFESSGVALDEDVCDARAIFTSAVEVIRSAAEAKGLVLGLEGLEALPEGMMADGKRLRQVLINFLGNAVKFTEKGAVTVIAETRASDRGTLLRATVRDTGIGIAPEAIERLFKEFSQVDGSIARRFGGTGLGLAISRKLIEAMGGKVGVDSTVGEGSSFWFEIPLRRAELRKSDAALETLSAPRRGLSILVAEDMPTNQMVLTAILKKLGHACVMTSNGAEAVEAAQKQTFDLVMLDMQMPVMDGLEAARRMRALGGACAGVPIVAVTANAFASDRDACFAAGMNGFVVKPYDPEEIAIEIARMTAGRAPAVAPPPPAFDASRLKEIVRRTSVDDVDEIVDALATDGAAMLARLAAQAQAGERDACLATAKALRVSYADLGLVFAAEACAMYIAELSDSRRPVAAPPARLAVDLQSALVAVRRALRESAAPTSGAGTWRKAA